MHCRTGMNTEYLGDEFMDMVSDCNETAKQKDMLCWLYDEDRYASGFGGGYVTRTDTRRTGRHSRESAVRGRNLKDTLSWHKGCGSPWDIWRDMWQSRRRVSGAGTGKLYGTPT